MLSDKIAKQEDELEHSDGFIDITYCSKDDLSKLSIGDFVKFSGTFCFNTVTNMTIDCENKNFDIKVSYTPEIKKGDSFNTDVRYDTTFKGIWGSFVVDLFDIESSFSEAYEHKSLEDYFKEYDNIPQERLPKGIDFKKDLSDKDNPYSDYDKQIEDLTDKVTEGMTNLFKKYKDDNSKSTLDKLLEQQYWNTELAKENEDLSKKLTHAQGTNRNLKKQVETLTIDRDNLSSQVTILQDKLSEARVITDEKVRLDKQVETLTKQVEILTKKFNNTSGELNETHKYVLDYKNERDDIIVKYNNLVRTYNQLRKDYIRLKDKELRVNIKNITLQIVEIILLSPLVMFKGLLIYSLLAALFGLSNI